MRIGVVAEGPTDHIVLKAIVNAVLNDLDDEPLVYQLQPPVAGDDNFGGWEQVFAWLAAGRYREALQFNHDLLIIHIDTDVCELPRFGVNRLDAGRPLIDAELVARVRDRLVGLIDATFLAEQGHKLVFAIAVNEIECWLLPVIFDSDQGKARKTTGCTDAASHELRKQKLDGLASGDKKFPKAYQQVARRFRKRKHVDAARAHSPSLDAFVVDLEGKCHTVAAPTA